MAKRKQSGYQRRYKHMRDLGYSPARARRGAKTGCYVATAVYGSYDCPEVWTLRRFRDHKLKNSVLGRAFIRTYYTCSPTIVKLFGKTRIFNVVNKTILDSFVKQLNSAGYENTPYQD